MGRPVRSEIPAKRATSRLSTAGGSPYSIALRNDSARLTPCSKQSRLSSLSSERRQSQLDNVSVRLPIAIVDWT